MNEIPNTTIYLEIAEKKIKANVIYDSTAEFCKLFAIPACEVDFEVTVTAEKLDAAEKINREILERDGVTDYVPSRQYIEYLALHKEIADVMPQFKTAVFHSSAISIDGRGILFAALSGTGKSTHAGIWKKYFGDRVSYINDDKPFVKVRDDGLYVFGSPWMGKHFLGANASAPVAAIGIIVRDEKNFAERVSAHDALATIFNQTYRPVGVSGMTQTVAIVKYIAEQVPIYKVHCNMDADAAAYIYKDIFGE